MIIDQPKLTIVGAGPGEIDLITVKGTKALRNAKVVLYDSHVNETILLEYAPTAIKLLVGKRRNRKAFSQEDINELIIEYAETYGHVVRLKIGGPESAATDLEEIQYAQSRGLVTEYIQGVSGLPDSVSSSIVKQASSHFIPSTSN
jgi:uroporphyrin-III C-methyltransferase